MIRDRNIAGRTKRLWIPVHAMAGLIDQVPTDSTIQPIVSLGAGSPIFQEPLAGAEISGLAMAANGDEIYHLLPIPWDMSRNHNWRARIWFVHSSTDADTPDWVIAATYVGKQGAIIDASAAADETLTFAAKATSTTDDSLEVLDFEESASAANMAETDFAIMLSVECNAISASANEITLLGIEIEYTLAGMSEGLRLTTDNVPAGDTKVDCGANYYNA